MGCALVNKTIDQIFREYRAEAEWLLEYYEKNFERLFPEDMERIAARMKQLEPLIDLYSELKIARRA
jgi:hypothetical protein